MKMKRKNPYLGGFLGLVFSLYSSAYYGFRTFLFSFVTSIVLYLIRLLYSIYPPRWFAMYFMPAFFVVYNFFMTKRYNESVDMLNQSSDDMSIEEYESEEKDTKVLFSIYYSTYALSFNVGIAFAVSEVSRAIRYFNHGHTWKGILALILLPVFAGMILTITNLVKNGLVALFGLGSYVTSGFMKKKIWKENDGSFEDPKNESL